MKFLPLGLFSTRHVDRFRYRTQAAARLVILFADQDAVISQPGRLPTLNQFWITLVSTNMEPARGPFSRNVVFQDPSVKQIFNILRLPFVWPRIKLMMLFWGKAELGPCFLVRVFVFA